MFLLLLIVSRGLLGLRRRIAAPLSTAAEPVLSGGRPILMLIRLSAFVPTAARRRQPWDFQFSSGNTCTEPGSRVNPSRDFSSLRQKLNSVAECFIRSSRFRTKARCLAITRRFDQSATTVRAMRRRRIESRLPSHQPRKEALTRMRADMQHAPRD